MNTSPTLSTTKYLTDVAKLNAQLNDDYAAWRNGSFRIYVLRPQTIEALRQATADQLTRRQIFIAQIRGKAYRTEYMNIRRILKEREQEAERQLQAAHAQQETFRLIDRVDVAMQVGVLHELTGISGKEELKAKL
jgi:hypothetical protein